MSDKIRILYVDDDTDLLDVGTLFLEETGEFHVTTASSAAEAIRLFAAEPADAIVSDYHMPGMNGIGFLSEVRRRFGPVPFILFTGRGREEVVIAAINSGVDFYLQKGGDPEAQFTELMHKIRLAVSRRRSEQALSESEKRFRLLVKNSNDLIQIMDTEGVPIFISNQIVRILGYTPEERIGIPSLPDIHPDDLPAVLEARNDIIRHPGTTRKVEYRYRHKNGTWIDLEAVGCSMLDDPDVHGIFVNIRDVTWRKQKRDALQKSEAVYRSIFDTALYGIVRTGPDFRFIEVNDTFCTMLEYAREDLVGRMTIGDITHPEDRAESREQLQKLIRQEGRSFMVEKRYITRTGRILHAMVFVVGVFDAAGTYIGASASVMDITGRKLMEEELRQSGERFRMLLQHVPSIAIQGYNCEGITQYWNEASEQLYGYSSAEAIGRNILDLIIPEEMQNEVRLSFVRMAESGRPIPAAEVTLIRKDRSRVDVFSHHALVKSAGNATELFCIDIDLSGRRKAEQALRESEELLRNIIEKNPMSIQIVDRDGCTLKVNAAHTRLFGSVPPPGFSIFDDLVAKLPELAGLIRRLKEGELVTLPDIRYNAHDTFPDLPDVPVWVRAIIFPLTDPQGRPERFVLMHENITAQKEAQERLSEINRTFLAFGPDPLENIMILTGLAGRMLKGTCALYNRLEGGMLHSLGMWNTPADFTTCSRPEGHICSDIIAGGDPSPTVIPRLQETAYAETDPAVRRYGLRTYAGIPVRIGERYLGSLCVVYQDDVTPAPQDLEILAMIAKAVSIEDERREAGLAQMRRTAFLEAQAEASPDGMLVVNDKNQRILTSKRLVSMWEIPDIILNDPDDAALLQYVVNRTKSPDEFLTKVRELYDHREESSRDIIEFSNGNVYERLTAPVIDSTGKYHGRIWTFRDITERRRAEDALRLANRKLTLLTGITRHDIRNQLTVLRGYLRILEKSAPDTARNEYFRKIADAAVRISSMIQFTEEYESIGVTEPVWQDLRTLICTAAAEAPLGQVAVQNDVPPGHEVFADPLIVKVFYNLMDNAVRYGETIRTIRFSSVESGEILRVVCEDDGIGVAAGEKEQIFERGFGRNTGFGLALSREILAITGLTITETGEPGKGARFGIAIPQGAWRRVTGNQPQLQ